MIRHSSILEVGKIDVLTLSNDEGQDDTGPAILKRCGNHLAFAKMIRHSSILEVGKIDVFTLSNDEGQDDTGPAILKTQLPHHIKSASFSSLGRANAPILLKSSSDPPSELCSIKGNERMPFFISYMDVQRKSSGGRRSGSTLDSRTLNDKCLRRGFTKWEVPNT
ncbi:hypothetical protein GQ457_14G016190 [Hibiscus cannabinus]